MNTAMTETQTQVLVRSDMVEAVNKFLDILERTNLHKLTFGKWCAQQLAWIDQIKQQDDKQKDLDFNSPLQRVHAALLATGEGFMSPKGMIVSSRVNDWALNAYIKSVGDEYAFNQLAKLESEEDYWHFIAQRLPGSALEALARKLEAEYLQRYKRNGEPLQELPQSA